MKYTKLIQKIKKHGLLVPTFIFLVFPASTHYKLKGYNLGGGGEVGSSSNYSAEGAVGQVAGKENSTTYKTNAGLQYVQQANTPFAPTFQNTGNWYNKLFFSISTANNATDATYLIAITNDNWVTTQYLNIDNTIGSTSYSISNFQSYATWGGGSGGYIIGLAPNTTYKIKVKSRQGKYTEGPFGPDATATTSTTNLTFDIDIAPTDIETTAPYAVSVGNLTSGNIVTAPNKIWIDIDTNAINGGQVFISDLNNGLKSTVTNYTINSANSDLAVVPMGFGITSASVTQVSGGPLAFQSPYTATGTNVGIVDSSMRLILTSSNAVTAGRASLQVQAKASSSVPAATDYADVLTLIAAGVF